MSSNVLEVLSQARILNRSNQVIVSICPYPSLLACMLNDLQGAGILTQETFNCVAILTTWEDGSALHHALRCLLQENIFTKENFKLVSQHVAPYEMAMGICFLHQTGLLTPENRELMTAHMSPFGIAKAIGFLHQALILTPENLKVVKEHANIDDFAQLIECFQKSGLLTQELFTFVAQHEHIQILSAGVKHLTDLQLLTSDNLDLYFNHANFENFNMTLFTMPLEILTQINFNALLSPMHATLFADEVMNVLWDIVPPHLLTQANFVRLLAASLVANPIRALRDLAGEMLGFDELPPIRGQVPVHIQEFNPEQSTHTASVHRSVSKSASRLMDSYGAILNLEATILEIRDFVENLESTPIHDAAKRCIERITAHTYVFTDHQSNVSTRQLLALVFIAMHDETQRRGSLEQAKRLFIEGLYEAQRGYNLSNGVDDGLDDGIICVAGTFNKIMETLVGIHLDVEIEYVTHEGAFYKFSKLVQHHLLAYLQTFISLETAEAYQQVKAIINNLKEQGMEAVWDNIKGGIEAEMWEEFMDAYANNPQHHLFREMIENGLYMNCPDLTEIESQLLQSLSYQEWLYRCEKASLAEGHILSNFHQHGLWTNHHILLNFHQHGLWTNRHILSIFHQHGLWANRYTLSNLHQYGLWANRHESAEAQHAFDSRYGLELVSTPKKAK